MISCKNYRDAGFTTDEYGVTLYWVYADLYTGNTPETLPTNAVGILGFPTNYKPENVRFAAGSVLTAVNERKMYMSNDIGQWVDWTTPINS